MRILCVDDDKTALTLYKSILTKHLYEEDSVEYASNGEEAVNLIQNSSFDCIITDLVMPGLDGLDVLKEAKMYEPKTEVIVVTGQGSIESAVEAMRLGARDYLTKPVNSGMLIEKIDNIRDYIMRENEAEEYRLAKEIMEENAMKTIADMEIKLDSYMTLLSEIKVTIADTSKSDAEKIKKMIEYIKEFDKNISSPVD